MTPPISWIRLERYHLGEGDAEERAHIEAALTRCETTRQRLDEIAGDVRPMPALPVVLQPARPWRRMAGWGGGLAAAAAVLLLVLPPPAPTAKGGDLALSLVRERGGSVTHEPERFLSGDRLSLRLTCPEGEPEVSVWITQDGSRYTPYPAQRVSCGNQVPIPGAFTVTGGGDVRVCADVDGEAVCAAVVAAE